MKTTELKKSLGLLGLTVYGMGNMLGAGIYGLIGKAVGELGNAVWMAFLASMIAAGLTGLSYASLGSKYPKAAGASYITHRAFSLPMLAYVIGLVVMASGLTSMAATMQVFAGYFMKLFDFYESGFLRMLIVTSVIILLGGINFFGLKEASIFNTICTAIEVGGLLLVIFVGMKFLGSVDYFDVTSVNNPQGEFSSMIILTGAILTFYSFMGFEDLLNVSEEVKNPSTTFPKALILSIVITSLVYMGICITVVSVVPHHQLASSSAPLSEVVQVAAPWFNSKLFSLMALFAVTNTALLNFIMSSRLAYGMSRQGLLPALIGVLHPKRSTPHVAIVVLGLLVFGLSLLGDMKDLAKATSILLLCSFSVVNASLIILKNKPGEPRGGFEVHWIIPALGILSCMGMVINEIAVSLNTSNTAPLLIAGCLVASISLLYLVLRPKSNIESS